ncbi:MAG TPA: hypothetical protein VIG62_20255 [Blastocatellia bacterium]|jgi:hypothetical protein
MRSYDRKRYLSGITRTAIMLALLAAMTLSHQGVQMTAAQSTGGFDGAIFDIQPTSSTLQSAVVGSTFQVTGRIFRFRALNQATCQLINPNEPVLGTWRAWGQVTDGGRILINHSLIIDDFNGSIEIQGTSGVTLNNDGAAPAIIGTMGPPFTGPSEAYSVTGGAGTYRSIQGEAHVRPYCQTEAGITIPFTYDRAFCLGIVEASRRRNR